MRETPLFITAGPLYPWESPAVEVPEVPPPVLPSADSAVRRHDDADGQEPDTSVAAPQPNANTVPQLPPVPADPLDHHKRFGLTAQEHVAALEWLSDHDDDFAALEDRMGELEEKGDTPGAAALQEQLDAMVAKYLSVTLPHLKRCKQFETYLRDKGWPYVCVDEAKRAIFGGAEIQSFDFLVYSTEGPNLLVLIQPGMGPVAEATLDGMREWEKVFGTGFRAVFVCLSDAGWTCRFLPRADGTMEERKIELLV